MLEGESAKSEGWEEPKNGKVKDLRQGGMDDRRETMGYMESSKRVDRPSRSSIQSRSLFTDTGKVFTPPPIVRPQPHLAT